ncbi:MULTISPECIES: type II secretion system secretin GspD [unclassified Thioalkalivibrio]|uniref:type II secretion system secretin GspD n=1 Tax=unclassified Thioalkalivibrio TaxID=2621013 RepID=UPI000377C0B2|nr:MULTISPECIES: type II secretion system secretin GspD [unclassified Thioalkalivibrio]
MGFGRLLGAALLAAVLAGCSGMQPSDAPEDRGSISPGVLEALERGDAPASAPAQDVQPIERPDDEPARDLVQIYPGTGELFDREVAAGSIALSDEPGEYTLNFEDASLREVANLILGDMLDRNVLIDPAVEGRVTLQTTRPLPESSLLAVLEELLRINGATLVEGDGMVRVTPRAGALRGQATPRLGSDRAGLNVRIVPLEFIGAAEMATILEPFLNEGSLIRVDGARNLLILAGTRRELANWQETIDIFDVDWLSGMSVGLFTLQNADAVELAEEVDQLMNAEGESPMAGMFRVIPIQRLNAVMVVTPQPRYLEDAETWVQRLDRTRDMQASRLHVYRMQHRRASDVAEVLGEVFGAETGTARQERTERDTRGGLAQGAEPALIGSGNGREGQQGFSDLSQQDARANDRGNPGSTSSGVGGNSGNGASNRDDDDNGPLSGRTRIVADDGNNSLLIYANTPDYEVLERALRQLDIAARQVLVDASIIEVTLEDELRYGVQWFLENSVRGYQGQGIFGRSDSLSRQFPGFNYSLVDSAGQVRAVISALAEDSMVNILSTPSVMVLDNHSATIRVGDQVPVRTSEATSVVTDNPVAISNIQFRDTGVNLQVTPRVNAGGMVSLDVLQEVNDVSETTSSGIDSPTIQQRLIESSVAVQSGETIVLGGLMRDQTSSGLIGIPGLRRLPVLGNLFSTTTETSRRTELLVLLTPRVAESSGDTRAITQEFKERMRGLGGLREQWERQQVGSGAASGDTPGAPEPQPLEGAN